MKTTEGLAEGTAKINTKQSFPQRVAGFWAGKDVVDPVALFQQLEKGAFPKGKLVTTLSGTINMAIVGCSYSLLQPQVSCHCPAWV